LIALLSGSYFDEVYLLTYPDTRIIKSLFYT